MSKAAILWLISSCDFHCVKFMVLVYILYLDVTACNNTDNRVVSYYSTIYGNNLMTRITPLLSYYCYCVSKLSFLFIRNICRALIIRHATFCHIHSLQCKILCSWKVMVLKLLFSTQLWRFDYRLEENHCGLAPFGQPCTNWHPLDSHVQTVPPCCIKLLENRCLPSKMAICAMCWYRLRKAWS